MHVFPGVKAALKRGSLIAAANWPVVVIQFVAEATFKMMLGVPLVGGALLVALVLGGDIARAAQRGRPRHRRRRRRGIGREAGRAVFFPLLLHHRPAGRLGLMFLFKGGTVNVLVAAEWAAPSGVEHAPWLSLLRRASQFSVERFLDGCQRFFRRYLRLGLTLLAVYIVSACCTCRRCMRATCLFGEDTVGSAAHSSPPSVRPASSPGSRSSIFSTCWCRSSSPSRTDRCGGRRAVCGSSSAPFQGNHAAFIIVLVLVLLATAASVVATTGLSLIAFVPVMGLAVLPLQLAAWMLRGLIFQYLGLSALGAYLSLYRATGTAAMPMTSPETQALSVTSTHRMIDYNAFLSRAARVDAGVGHPQDGHGPRRSAGRHLVRTRISRARHVPWQEFAELASTLLGSEQGHVLQYGPTRGYRPLLDAIVEVLAERHIQAGRDSLLVTTGSQQGLDLVSRVLLDPGDVVLVELPSYTGALTAFRNARAELVGVPQQPDGIDLDALDATLSRVRSVGQARAVPLRRPEFPESDRAPDRSRQAVAAARVGRPAEHADRRGRSVRRAALR